MRTTAASPFDYPKGLVVAFKLKMIGDFLKEILMNQTTPKEKKAVGETSAAAVHGEKEGIVFHQDLKRVMLRFGAIKANLEEVKKIEKASALTLEILFSSQIKLQQREGTAEQT